jgi:predicted ATP-grasp superfamily ATP-dependent carboligase
MSAIPIIGQKSRQQRRDDERNAAKNIGQFMARTMHLFNQMAQDLNLVHMRVNIAFETMRLLGATDEQIKEAADKAEAAVQALEDAKLAQVQERLAEAQLLTQPEDGGAQALDEGEDHTPPQAVN